MNIAIIYHSSDFDGILSNEVCRFHLARLYPDAAIHSYGWDYGRPVPLPIVSQQPPDVGCPTAQGDGLLEWRFWDAIYIVDLSVDELMARPELRDKIVWIDHHRSAIEKWDRDQVVGPETKPPTGGYGGSLHGWGRAKDPFHADSGVPEELRDQFPKGDQRSGWVGLDAFGNSIAWVPDGTRIGGPGMFTGYRIDGVAACRLCWQWFTFDKGPHGDPRTHPSDIYTPYKQDFIDRRMMEPELIRLAGEYDIWDHRDPNAKILQFGLRACSEREFRELVQWQFGGWPEGYGLLQNILGGGKLIKSYMDKQNAEYAAQMSGDVFWEGLCFLAINSSHRNSDAFLGAIKERHDALLNWRYDPKSRLATISLYHATGREDIDLSKIAVKYGGGGHKGACGFRMLLHDLEAILHGGDK